MKCEETKRTVDEFVNSFINRYSVPSEGKEFIDNLLSVVYSQGRIEALQESNELFAESFETE